MRTFVILIHITLVRRRFAKGRPEGRISLIPTDPRPLLQLSKSIRLRLRPQLSAGDGGELRTVSEAPSPSSGQQSFFLEARSNPRQRLVDVRKP
jgi:hypothetical protein